MGARLFLEKYMWIEMTGFSCVPLTESINRKPMHTSSKIEFKILQSNSETIGKINEIVHTVHKFDSLQYWFTGSQTIASVIYYIHRILNNTVNVLID